MQDMLVKLYNLPDMPHPTAYRLRRALAPEKHLILDWVEDQFSTYWRSECDVAIHNQPVSCFVATQESRLLGFACYDATRRGFFGPMGVDGTQRGRGIGQALLLACLHDMWAQGYGYAIIGGVGPAAFYEKTVSATLIPDSTPGVYQDLLREYKP